MLCFSLFTINHTNSIVLDIKPQGDDQELSFTYSLRYLAEMIGHFKISAKERRQTINRILLEN